MKILLSILEILMILGIITNYKLLKKRKEEKKEEWLISYLFIKLIDMKRYLLVFLKKGLYTKSGAWKKIPAPDFNFYMQKDKYPI